MIKEMETLVQLGFRAVSLFLGLGSGQVHEHRANPPKMWRWGRVALMKWNGSRNSVAGTAANRQMNEQADSTTGHEQCPSNLSRNRNN